MTDNEKKERFRGVGEPARQKTLGERPVSDKDIQELSDRIDRLNTELEDLKARGATDLPPRS